MARRPLGAAYGIDQQSCLLSTGTQRMDRCDDGRRHKKSEARLSSAWCRPTVHRGSAKAAWAPVSQSWQASARSASFRGGCSPRCLIDRPTRHQPSIPGAPGNEAGCGRSSKARGLAWLSPSSRRSRLRCDPHTAARDTEVPHLVGRGRGGLHAMRLLRPCPVVLPPTAVCRIRPCHPPTWRADRLVRLAR